jgi:Zn-dependent protease with chaperone function
VTRQVPLDWEIALSQRALKDMDRSIFRPSKLPARRQGELSWHFNVLAHQLDPGLQRYRGYAPRLALVFRSGLGANALALPGGTIVITDGLVEAAAQQGLSDDALIGVLAHEIGHVVHRHTTRMVVEQAVLNIGLGLAMGDLSSLVSVGGSLLTGMAYRRGHETEADCFAAALMHKAHLPTEPMADLLLGLERARTRQAPSAPVNGDADAVASLLSSHPATALRAQQLKQGRLQGC